MIQVVTMRYLHRTTTSFQASVGHEMSIAGL